MFHRITQMSENASHGGTHFLLSAFGRNEPAAFFHPQIGLLTLYAAGIAIPYTAYAFAGSPANIGDLVNGIFIILKFNNQRPHFPGLVKPHYDRHIFLFSLFHALTPVKYPTGCMVWSSLGFIWPRSGSDSMTARWTLVYPYL